jgi:hypothetical protein
MDFHEDLKLPAEAIAQIADDTRNARADLAPGSAETPVSSVTSRVRSSGTFPGFVALRSQSRLMLEGRARTLSGPFPAPSQPGLVYLPAPAARPDSPACTQFSVSVRSL